MPLNRREEAELACFEYLLGLRDLGLGPQAARIFERYRVQEIRPLHLRVRRLQERVRVTDKPPTEAELDAIEAEWAGIYGRCLEELKTLWLTEGQGREAWV